MNEKCHWVARGHVSWGFSIAHTWVLCILNPPPSLAREAVSFIRYNTDAANALSAALCSRNHATKSFWVDNHKALMIGWVKDGMHSFNSLRQLGSSRQLGEKNRLFGLLLEYSHFTCHLLDVRTSPHLCVLVVFFFRFIVNLVYQPVSRILLFTFEKIVWCGARLFSTVPDTTTIFWIRIHLTNSGTGLQMATFNRIAVHAIFR